MSERQEPYLYRTSTQPIGKVLIEREELKVTYTNGVPDVREYLVGLRRDLLRKIKQLDEMIASLNA